LSTLLVASTGGHLKELHHLHGRLSGIDGPFHWVTFDTPQSRSLLEGETVDFVPFVGGRDPVNVTRNLAAARRVLRDRAIDAVVSTGSAVALPYFALARLRGLRCHYVESAARIEGPSLTGRLISSIPGVHRYAQYPGWSGGRWGYGGAVFDAFERRPRAAPAAERLAKVVVTLGTYRGYGFPRLVRRLLEILPATSEVLWQTGDTDTRELGIEGHYAIPERTALAAFEVGKCPLLVPRRVSLGEHVDDHQTQVAGELGERGLSVSVEADELGYEDLVAAAAGQVAMLSAPPPFVTAG
jgi:hypothetical protein